MLKTWLKRAALTLTVCAVLAVLAAWTWWRVADKNFLYGAILPDAARLLEGKDIPALEADTFRQDLAFLARELPRLHVRYEEAFRPQEVTARIAELSAAAEALSPAQRALEILGLMASGDTGTGHTMLFPFQPGLDWQFYPLSTYWFDDGLFVTATETRYEEHIGARILRIGGVDTDEALERLAPYVAADNASSLKSNLPRLLAMAEPMMALGLASPGGSLEVEVQGPTTLRLDPISLTSLRGLGWSRQSFKPVAGAWSPADPRPRQRNFSLDYRASSKTLYFQFNVVENQNDESLSQFAQRLDEAAGRYPVERFIIDLRANGGGNNELARPLIETISDHPVLDRKGVLYVLLGRRTFSAAANFACALERRTKAIFVGESSGFAPNHFGDAVSFLLPHSKIVVRLASRAWIEDLPGVQRSALEPDLVVPFLARHHFEGEDPALAAVADHQPAVDNASAEEGAPARLPSTALGTYLLSPHHRLRLLAEEGRDRLILDGAGRYATTDLHATEAGLFATDIRGMILQLQPGGPPTLRWHNATFPLQPVSDDHLLPLELLQNGQIAAGVAAFRAEAGSKPLGALGSGLPLGSDFELAINRIAYQNLGAGRTDDALLAFTLNTELFPGSANVWDGLGDAFKAAGRVQEARKAYRHALERSPVFSPSQRSLAELGEGPGAVGSQGE